MKKELNILHISPYFNYVCGVSKYVYLVLKELKKSSDSDLKLNLHFITNGGDGLNRLLAAGIKPTLFTFKKGVINSVYLKNNIIQLEDFCLNNDIDVIHTHHRYPELLSSIIQKRIFSKTGKKIKTITTAHSIVKGYRSISFQSDKIIAVSNTIKKYLIDNYRIPEEKIIQQFNPVDRLNNKVKEKIGRNKYGIPDESKIILYVGRFSNEKGIKVLLKAFSEIVKHKNVFLMMISDANEKEQKKIISRNSKIIFIKPCDDITEYYQLADIVVVPSLIESSLPYAVIESASNKKLLITSNIEVMKEFIEHNKHVIMFETDNHKALINAIYQAINMSEENKHVMTENLYSLINMFDNPKNYANKLLNIYINL